MKKIKNPDATETTLSPLQISSHPLYLQAKKYILNHIKKSTWLPSEQLPPDMNLAKRLGINHITLGKALNILRDEGYLVRNRGRGTFIADKLPNTSQKTEFDHKIALVFDDTNESTFMVKLFLAIHNTFQKYNLRMEFISSRGDNQLQLKQLLRLVKDKHISGCILWSILNEEQFGKFLTVRPALFPVVLLDHQVNGASVDFSGYDDYGSGEMLGRHLAACGIQRCCLLQSQEYACSNTNRQRQRGLQDGLGFELEKFTGYHGLDISLTAYIRRLCRETVDPIAVVTIFDKDAEIITRLLKKYTPHSNNIRLFTFCTSAKHNFAGIRMPVTEMGSNAVEIIHARLAGNANLVIETRASGILLPE